MAAKIDFKRELDCYRARRDTPQVVSVPRLQYLMIDGHGDPNTPVFAEATAALYPVAYAVKFASARALDRDYVVMPLEGVWWADDLRLFTAARDKTQWHWTLMIMVPDWITHDLVRTAVDRVRAKSSPSRLPDVRMESLDEGLCVQTLHVGSYDDEAEVLRQLHDEFIPNNGLRMAGRHHEIYLSDARRVAPDKLRTILRQPVIPATASDDTPAHRPR